MQAKITVVNATNNQNIAIDVDYYEDDLTTFIFTKTIHILNAEADGPTAEQYIKDTVSAIGNAYTAETTSLTKTKADGLVNTFFAVA